MGVQACTPKKAQTNDPVKTTETTTQEASKTSPKEASSEEAAKRPAESQDRSAESQEGPIPIWGMERNSQGEKCEDVCEQESSGELICSDMCCWLQAVECCPDYRPPTEGEK